MNTMIFVMQIGTNVLIYGLIARWYLMPRLRVLPLAEALTPLLLLHMLRTMGATFVIPQVVGQTLPAAFAVPGAVGDLLAVVLAGLALVAVRARWRVALVLVWVFNVAGTLDFIVAFAQGARFGFAEQYQLGPIWFIPTFFVPAFFVAHMVMFALLVTNARQPHARFTLRSSGSRA